MKNLNLYLVSIFFITLSSCKSIILKTYGINEKKYSYSGIVAFAKKDKIDSCNLYLFDSQYNELKKIDTIKFHRAYQPLQVLIYDKNKQFINSFVNCDLKGFPNLNFNQNNSFDDSLFIRKDKYLSINLDMQTRQPYILNSSKCNINLLSNKKTIYLFYANIMGRQKRKLFKLVRNYSKERPSDSIEIKYINMNLFFSKIIQK